MFLMNNIKTAGLKKNEIRYIVVWIALLIFVCFVFTYNKRVDINRYLDQKTVSYTQNYKSIYEDYKKLSEAIFYTVIDTPKVQALFYKRDRKKLYNTLLDTYKLLRKYNLKQLHFHLPNNHSFLRFHRPNKYGDDLTNIRATVRYVNRYKKPIDGFEEGRIYNGYRFVFPMFYQNKYIGSVETSFSTLAFTVEFSKIHNIVCNFLILKNVTDKKVFQDEKSNYINSPFENFYQEAKTATYIAKMFHTDIQFKVGAKTKMIIASIEKQKDSFSVYDPIGDEILTFIKVKNPVTHKLNGLFVARSDASFIRKQNLIYKTSLITLIIGITAILFFIYRDNKSKENLSKINKTLEERVQKEVEKSREKDKVMLQQSRLAQMGEMLSMIAHQWRQPLSAISTTSANLILKAKLGVLDNESAIKLAEKISAFTQHLSDTIDDFRNFFKPDKTLEDVTYSKLVQCVLNIVEDSLKTKNIQLKVDIQSDVVFKSYPNELKQVILNLVKNAEDVLLEREVKNSTITIEAYGNQLRVKDNAGGVPESIIDKIFDPYFSTKTQKNGTGIGLYMSKTIVEDHCKGELKVYNDEEGAVFEIELPIIKDVS